MTTTGWSSSTKPGPCYAQRPRRYVASLNPVARFLAARIFGPHRKLLLAARSVWLRAAKWCPAVAGSGDQQAKAELCCIEIDEVAVAFGPPA